VKKLKDICFEYINNFTGSIEHCIHRVLMSLIDFLAQVYLGLAPEVL